MKGPHNLSGGSVVEILQKLRQSFLREHGVAAWNYLVQLQKSSNRCARVEFRLEQISGWDRIVARRAVKVVRTSLFAAAKSDSAYPRLIGMVVFDFALGFVNLHS